MARRARLAAAGDRQRGVAGRRLPAYPLLLGLLLLVAGGARFRGWEAARLDGVWLPRDGDSCYHLRHVERIIERGGRVPGTDPWLSFPRGQRIPWPPGYDLLVAGLAAPACASDPSAGCQATVAMLLTPLLGLLTTALVLLLGQALLGRWPGLLAAGLFAIYPFAVAPGSIGLVDHHALEPLLVAGWFFALTLGCPLIAGLIGGAGFWCFPSALLPVATTCVALGVQWIAATGRGTARGGAAAPRFTLAATAVLMPLVLTHPLGDSWSLAAPSRLHLLVMGAICLALLVASASGKLQRRGRRPWLLPAVGAAAALVAVAAAGWSKLGIALRFGVAGGLWSEVAQQRSAGTGPIATAVLMALIAAACLACLRGTREPEAGSPDRGATLGALALAALPLGLLGALQIRFLMPAAPLLVVVLVRALVLVDRAVGPARGRRPLIAALVGLLLLPAKDTLRARVAEAATVDVVRLLTRLGQRHRGRRDGGDGRAVAVLADWTWGHHVLRFARLPTVASPMILTGAEPANLALRRGLGAARPAALYELMRRRRARYLLLTPRIYDPARAARRWPRLRVRDREGAAWLFELDHGDGQGKGS